MHWRIWNLMMKVKYHFETCCVDELITPFLLFKQYFVLFLFLLSAIGVHISLKPRDHHARDKLTVNVTEKRLEPNNVTEKRLEPNNVTEKRLEPNNVTEKRLEPNNVTEKRLEPKKWRGGGGGVVLLSAGKIAELWKNVGTAQK